MTANIDADALEQLIGHWVEVQGHSCSDPMSLKIEVLFLMLDKLRRAKKQKGEQIASEHFEESTLFADTDRLVLSAPPHYQGERHPLSESARRTARNHKHHAEEVKARPHEKGKTRRQKSKAGAGALPQPELLAGPRGDLFG